MTNYFKIHFHSGEVLYVKASSIHRVELWILQNRPMSDWYAVNIIAVNQDKTVCQPPTFLANAVREYYHYAECYGNLSDEEIRQREIEHVKARIARKEA